MSSDEIIYHALPCINCGHDKGQHYYTPIAQKTVSPYNRYIVEDGIGECMEFGLNGRDCLCKVYHEGLSQDVSEIRNKYRK